jgi:hypothetical protein
MRNPKMKNPNLILEISRVSGSQEGKSNEEKSDTCMRNSGRQAKKGNKTPVSGTQDDVQRRKARHL